MKKIAQKLIAKLINSFLVKNNPYILKNIVADIDDLNQQKIKIDLSLITIGNTSKLFKETTIHNCAGDKTKIIIGNGTHIQGELLVQKYGGQINIGHNCYVGIGTKIWSGESVFIGNNVLISHNCNIIDSDTHEIYFEERAKRSKELMENGPLNIKGNILTKPIVIEDFAWISFNVSILKGVTIGKGAIVAAGAVVTKNVAAFTVVAGNPAIVVKELPQ